MDETFRATYSVMRVLRKGGMSTVYLAEHRRLQKLCAVKQVSRQQNVRFNLLAESDILKRLKHPMLPTILDIFMDPYNVYIVEEYVEGIALDQLLETQMVDEQTGIRWFRDLCGVLTYLHHQYPPIIYRDMKPSNIMVKPDGTLVLVDFDIAREYKEGSASDTIYLGSRGYAAPEQYGGAQTDPRTDIYSLGATMYHVFTGKGPLQSPQGFVPPRQLNPGLSPHTEQILLRCVQPDPMYRYQSADELLYDLNSNPGIPYGQPWWRRPVFRRAIAGAAAAAVVIVIGIALFLSFSGGTSGDTYTSRNSGSGTSQSSSSDTSRESYSELMSRGNSLSSSDPERAIQAYSDAIELDDGLPDAYVKRGQMYLQMDGRMEDAEADFQAALDRNDTLPEAWIGLADACLAESDTAGARQALEQGQEKTGGNTEISERLNSLLQEIRGEIHVKSEIRPVENTQDLYVTVFHGVYENGETAWTFQTEPAEFFDGLVELGTDHGHFCYAFESLHAVDVQTGTDVWVRDDIHCSSDAGLDCLFTERGDLLISDRTGWHVWAVTSEGETLLDDSLGYSVLTELLSISDQADGIHISLTARPYYSSSETVSRELVAPLDPASAVIRSGEYNWAFVPEGGLNLRSEPSHRSGLVLRFTDKRTLFFNGEKGEGPGSDGIIHTWYKVTTEDGVTGWARGDLLQEVSVWTD